MQRRKHTIPQRAGATVKPRTRCAHRTIRSAPDSDAIEPSVIRRGDVAYAAPNDADGQLDRAGRHAAGVVPCSVRYAHPLVSPSSRMTSRLGAVTRTVSLSLLVVAVPVASHPLVAQESRLERTVDIAGNYLYGNNDQLILSARAGISARDTLYGFRVESRYLIGVSGTSAGRRMDRRSWLFTGSLDRRPEDRHSQFILASVEQSLELRINSRVNAGAGYKYVIDCDTTYQLDASAAVVGEWSSLPPTTVLGAGAGVQRSQLLRLSNRLRFRNQFTDKMNFDHVTLIRPQIDDWSNFLGSSQTSIGYLLSSRTSLRLSFQNDYDSQSRSRGARSNHNGQMLVGVAAKF